MSLPKGYKRLEYIQSSGTQYIDTGLDYFADFEVGIQLKENIANKALGNGQSYCLQRQNAATGCWQYTSGSTSYNTSLKITDYHILAWKNNTVYADGEKLTGFAKSRNDGSRMLLFAAESGNQYPNIIHFCKLWDNDNLVRDFIPCQNASGAVGLWDAVNSVFYGNAGTGTFTAGPVVPEQVDESEITELEYIQSSGTQYVKTNFYPNNNTRVLMDFVFAGAYSGNIGLCGARTSSASKTYCFWFYTDYITSCRFDFANNSDKGTEVKLPSGERLTLDMNQNTCTCGDFSQTKTDADFQSDYDLALFGINTAGAVGTMFTGKLYFIQVYNNGLLERDFIPAMLSNGEVGLYDRVFHEFYRNAGTSEFIAGPEAQTVPKAPANFRVESESDTLVTLAWDEGEDALGYRLYRQGQLLADITETSVSVEVEPFSGAVFTLTAYDENGEGAGTSLTYFKAPENPILFLITDRTQADVAERNAKGYYAASDLNRVGYAVKYLAGRLRSSGVSVAVSPVLTWTDADWATPTTMKGYLADVQTMRDALKLASTTPEVPEDMERLTYTEANEIEAILLALDTHIKQMLMTVDAGWAMGLAYTGFYAKEAY